MSYTTQKYLKFNAKEIQSVILTVVVLGFIFSFRSWGVSEFNALYGLVNFVIAVALIGFSLIVKLCAQKYASIKVGYAAEFRPWLLGLALGVLLSFASNGKFIFLAIGGMTFSLIETIRIGHFRHGLNYETMGWLSAFGVITNILLAALFKILLNLSFINQDFAIMAISINLWMALYGILPIPFIKNMHAIDTSDGLNLLIGSRWAYVGVFALVISSIVAILFLPVISAVIATLFFTLFIWVMYYILYEQHI